MKIYGDASVEGEIREDGNKDVARFATGGETSFIGQGTFAVPVIGDILVDLSSGSVPESFQRWDGENWVTILASDGPGIIVSDTAPTDTDVLWADTSEDMPNVVPNHALTHRAGGSDAIVIAATQITAGTLAMDRGGLGTSVATTAVGSYLRRAAGFYEQRSPAQVLGDIGGVSKNAFLVIPETHTYNILGPVGDTTNFPEFSIDESFGEIHLVRFRSHLETGSANLEILRNGIPIEGTLVTSNRFTMNNPDITNLQDQDDISISLSNSSADAEGLSVTLFFTRKISLNVNP